MKLLSALLGVSMGIVLAMPTHADPGIDEAPSNDNNGVFLSDRFNLRIACAPVTFGGIDASIQIAAARMGNQTHDEHLIPADEQWSSRREQLASSGRSTSVTI